MGHCMIVPNTLAPNVEEKLKHVPSMLLCKEMAESTSGQHV